MQQLVDLYSLYEADPLKPDKPDNKQKDLIEHDMEVNGVIAATASFPFMALAVIFTVILCRRKIEDFYLWWSALILLLSILLRIFMSSIASLFYYSGYEKNET